MELNNRVNFQYNKNQERRFLSNGFIKTNEKEVSSQHANTHLNSVNRNSSAISNKSLGDRSNSVVFERIVPNAVKKMWVMAESENNNDQKQAIRRSSIESGQRLTSKYGNFFISRDAAKEHSESNEELVKKMRSDSVSESTELPHVKTQWGVQLKPVDNEDSRKLSSNEKKQRPKSVLLDNKTRSHSKGFGIEHRSHSLENILDQSDGKSDDYPTKLTVQQRMKNFEKSPNKGNGSQSDKYAYLHTKRPLKSTLGDVDLRGKSTIFYQPHKTTTGEEKSQKVTETTRSKPSLKDLLKQDEVNLSVDVLQHDLEGDQNNNKDNDEKKITNTIFKHNNIKKNSHNHSTAERNDIMKKQENVSNTEQNNFVNLKTKQTSEISLPTPVTKDENQSHKNESVNVLPSTKITLEEDAKISSQKSDHKDVNKQPTPNESSFNKSHFVKNQEIEENLIQPTQLTDKVDDKEQFNKFGQSVLSLKPIKGNILTGNKAHSDKVKDSNTYIISNDKNKDINESAPVIPKVEPCNNLEKKKIMQEPVVVTNGEKLKRIENDSNIQTKKPVLEHKQPVLVTKKVEKSNQIEGKHMPVISNFNGMMESNTNIKAKEEPVKVTQETQKDEKPRKYENNTNPKTKPPTKSLPVIPPSESKAEHKPKVENTQGGIRRRVGKLIIMTGEQRDQNLKELARIKAGLPPSNASKQPAADAGMSITFLSNEVADDDPDEPPAVVPKIVYNKPVPKLRSILSPQNKKKKPKVRISFLLKKIFS